MNEPIQFTYARAGSYTLEDPIGVELAGALKNVYAIASGIAEGLGFENNTRASKSMTSVNVQQTDFAGW